MNAVKIFFSLLFVFGLVFSVSRFASAAWTVPSLPPSSPVDCLATPYDPACNAPINVSSAPQIKAGPLGVSNTLMTFSNFFASSTGIGLNFVNGTWDEGDIPAGVSLDLQGQISIRGGTPQAGYVLTSSNSSGLANWSAGSWIDDPIGSGSNIRNLNSGNVGVGTPAGGTLPAKLTINGGIGKLGNSMAPPADVATQVNLGCNSMISSNCFATSSTNGVGATVGGGINNFANSYGTVSGGANNVAGQYGTVSGGINNQATGQYSTVSGGHSNIAAGNYSWAGGRFAQLAGTANNTFVWDNGTSAPSPQFGSADSFLVFPRPASTGRMAVGTTTEVGYRLKVDGGVKVYAPTVGYYALDVRGPVRLNPGGTIAVGSVLTATSTSGDAVWAPPANTIKPGESVMYLRRACQSSCSVPSNWNPASCPSGWTGIPAATGAGTQEFAGGGVINIVRVCYRTDIGAQVMYLRASGASANCPASPWVQADYQPQYAGSSLNNVRTCYKENP